MARLDAQKGETLALSAFALSGLQSPLARKQLVKEMWESGADVIVLIDHNTLSGFESIAEAREQLLQMGRKELDNESQASADASPRGAYAVAPCPHDGACPLWHPESRSNKLVCGFSQRIQRPGFVRKTKHSGVGHEDIGYSYVVIKRGQRPVVPKGFPKLGRLGQVGKREIASLEAKLRASIPLREMEEIVASDELTSIDLQPTAPAQETPAPSRARVSPTEPEDADFDLDASLRLEANAWPRLVFPPLKRSGHVILDVCSPTGQILRSTIPKSQGKQPYYDARKSAWGDLFPHEPKNKPQARYVPPDGRGPMRGADIGKRGVDVGNEDMSKMPVYGKIAEDVKKRKKEIRRERFKSKWDADD
jgi:ribosomal protein RSM22 (predicted rRNA methylase)